MKKDKTLLLIDDISKLDIFQKEGYSNFLLPLKGYSVGYQELDLDSISSLKANVYLLANRILNDEEIDAFFEHSLPECVKGIFIEDIGLYYELRARNTSFELISFQNHLNNNYKTVNYWLKYFDSILLSTDITYEECAEIIDNALDAVVVLAFGRPQIMYSRRKLISNYYEHSGKKGSNTIEVRIPNNSLALFLKENDYGTVVYPNSIIDARREVSTYPEERIKFYLVDTTCAETDSIMRVLRGEEVDNTDKGFLYKKTIYRVGDDK